MTNDYKLLAGLLSELSFIGAEVRSLRVENAELRSERKTTNKKKLSRGDAARIRDLKRSGKSQAEIADIFNVNPATVSRIVRGQYHK